MILVESIVLAYFVYVAGYAIFFSLAGHFYVAPRIRPNFRYFRFCVLIPAYKEDAVILETVNKTIEQAYPADKMHVVVIADSLQPDTIVQLNQLPLQVVTANFSQSTKVKSLRLALETLPEYFDYAVILDADNIPEDDFIFKVNDLLHTKSLQVVQCQRQAKNNENNLAFLDGLSEAINNHIYRQGATAVKLSASISGSGIVVDFNLLKTTLPSMDSVGGFDRELELRFLKNDIKVFYYKDATVLDEKVSGAQTFQNQRRRWISSQYVYLKKYFWDGLHALAKGNITFFNSAILRNIQLPRLINLGLLFCLTIVLFPVRENLFFSYMWWPTLLGSNLFAILIAIPFRHYSWDLLKSIITVPGIFFRMLLLLFRLRGANKTFIHTPHTIKHAVHEPR
jgi:cellulose synthase/poly-beta-1,6-N-acetylglucosamine synthase-like glycosyltransferase